MHFFSFLTALAGTSSRTLKRSGEGRHLFFVPNLGGKAFSLSPLIVMSAIGVYVEVSSIPGFAEFLITRMYYVN